MKIITNSKYEELLAEARMLLQGNKEQRAIGRGMLRVLLTFVKPSI